MFLHPPRRSSFFGSPPSPSRSRSRWPPPASGSAGRVVFLADTTSVPFIPSAAWSPTVQRNSYVPRPSFASPHSILPGPKIGVPPRSDPSFCTCRSCASEPLLRSTKRTMVGWEVPAFTVTVFGSNAYSFAPNAIGWLRPTVTTSPVFSPPSPFLSPPPHPPRAITASASAARRGFGMAADNMRAHAEATPLHRLLRRGLRRVRDRLREQDRCVQQGQRPGPSRGRAVPRSLQRLPHARRRRRIWLEARGQGPGRRAHRR